MKKTINLLALFVLVSVNVFTPVSYAQLDDLQVSVPETVDQNFSPKINDGGDLDNEDQNVVEIPEDKVGEITNFDDYDGGDESEKEDDEKTGVEDIPEVSDNMGGSLIDIVVDAVDEYFEVKEPKVEKSEVEEPEEKESGEQELGGENVVPDRNLLDLVKESDLRVNDSQIVQDLELYFLGVKVKYYSIMDRNLGASEVYNQDWDNQNIESYGYMFQRGNNYGFTSTSSDFIEEFTGIQVPKSVRSEYSPSGYRNNIRYRGEDSWMGSGSTYDNIWGGAGDIVNGNGAGTVVDRQGPCPDGYHIPSVHDWSLIKNDWSAYANRSNRRADFAYDLLLPPAGTRKNESSVARAFQVGQVGTYRTSSPRGDLNIGAYALYFDRSLDGYNPPITDAVRSRSLGANLRCFKNDFQSGGNLNFHLNGGEGGVIAVNDKKFTSMSNPYRLASIFEGWYTTPDFQTGTKLGVGSGTEGVTDLYAKWGCIEGYILSENACVGGTIVTFDTYGGVSQPWSITVPYGTVLDFSGQVANFPDGTTVKITGEAIAYSGQTFAGWSTGNNYRTVKTLVIPDYNITLHAIYRNNLTINFNATKNGGETNTGSISVPYGTIIDLSNYTATKGSGGVRTFLGWNTDPHATGVFSNNYKAENEDSDYTTLYAIFRKDKFNVNFDTNGHGVTPSSQTIYRGNKIIDPGNLSAPGYEFEGWSDNEYLTTSFDFGTFPTDDVTLYAKWRVPGAECYEGFEYDNNLGMCIKKNEWVIRVGMNGTVLLSSKYSDLVDWYISMVYSGLDLSKVQGLDIAKSYLGIILSEQISNNFLDIDYGEGGGLTPNGGIMEILAGSGNDEDKELLFTMITKGICRGEEPDLSCNFYSLDTIKSDNILSWDNVSIPIPDIVKEHTPPEFLERFEWADNIRIIFDPRAFITFDSNGHGNAPAPQFVNEGGRINKPQSPSAEGYNFLGWSEDAYLTSIFDFNTVVDKDTKLYAKWGSIGSNGYSCPEGQEYDDSVGLCKRPKDWIIRIGYQGDMEFSSGYSLFLDNVLLSGLNLEMSESEVEAFKKAFGILLAASETFDGTDEIVIDEAGVVADGDLWLLNYYNKDGKLLFTVVVDMAGTENNSSGWSINLIIHTRSTYVNVATDVSSLDNLKLTPSSTGINEYAEAYPPIAQLENLWIIFSDRMEPNIIDNGGNHYSGGGKRVGEIIDTGKEHGSAVKQSETNESDIDRYDSRYPQEFNEAYQFSYNNKITTVGTIEEAKMYTPIKRIEMAKMLSYYAMNVLGQEPDDTLYISFKDVSDKMDAEYDNGVILAYQLGIMGINMPNNKFRPNDYVTRAEFATALSRMLYGLDDGRPNYYSTHFEKLKSEGIMTKLDPNMLEIRGYVMLMLMRAANG